MVGPPPGVSDWRPGYGIQQSADNFFGNGLDGPIFGGDPPHGGGSGVMKES